MQSQAVIMTKNPEIYTLPDEAFYINHLDYSDLVSAIEATLTCYELFDPVILDVEKNLSLIHI